MNTKTINIIKILIFVLMLSMGIFLLYRYVIYRTVVEPMIFDGKYIRNIYSKYNIKINTSKKTLTKGKQTISYYNFTNSLMSAIFANNKYNVNKLLSSFDLPVCKQLKWINNMSVNDNIKIINNELKYPLIIKPASGERGFDVLTDIHDNDLLIHSVRGLQNKGINEIVIEQQSIGEKYRILIINQYIIYVKYENVPIIIGDGKSTIRQLIKKYPDIHKTSPIKHINETLIKQQGYKINSILENSREIRVTNVISASNGSNESIVDPTKINEVNNKMFIDVSKALKLNCCGIDYITPDLSIPYTTAGNIIEVNSGPGITENLLSKPKIHNALIDALFSTRNYV